MKYSLPSRFAAAFRLLKKFEETGNAIGGFLQEYSDNIRRSKWKRKCAILYISIQKGISRYYHPNYNDCYGDCGEIAVPACIHSGMELALVDICADTSKQTRKKNI